MKKSIVILLVLFLGTQVFASQTVKMEKGLTLSSSQKQEVLKNPGKAILFESTLWTNTFVFFEEDENLIKKTTHSSYALYWIVSICMILMLFFFKNESEKSCLLQAKEILNTRS